MRNGKKPTKMPNLVIKPAWEDGLLQGPDGQRHCGVMVAVDDEGNEVARGTTYAEFMASLKNSYWRVIS
jgi:hypothetical protein